jgi:hypothetical protein
MSDTVRIHVWAIASRCAATTHVILNYQLLVLRKLHVIGEGVECSSLVLFSVLTLGGEINLGGGGGVVGNPTPKLIKRFVSQIENKYIFNGTTVRMYITRYNNQHVYLCGFVSIP